MIQRSTIVRSLVILASGSALAGCSGWSLTPPLSGNPDVEPCNLSSVQSAAPANPTTFPQALTAEYSTLATKLRAATAARAPERDYADADYFARKGLATARGEVVLPENVLPQGNNHWLIPLEQPYKYRTLLDDARKRLLAALDNGGRDRLPLVAARAQARYDCWVERMEDSWWNEVDGQCHKEFLAAMEELEGKPVPAEAPATPPPQVHEYRVYFEFDKSTLQPEALAILQKAADDAKGDSKIRLELVGKADLSGTDSYNLGLSQRRADAVREQLAKDGVTADRIAERWVGDREPPVPTPKGVREPRNRVVEITVH